MNIDQQVVSLDLAKELRANGYKQEGIWWWAKCSGIDYAISSEEEMSRWKYISDKIVTPTVAELGERLPDGYKTKRKCGIWFGIGSGISDGLIQSKTEADARAKMWIYLKQKGLR